jgi:hypothetical protein
MRPVKTFTFILNPVTTTIHPSYEIIPGHVFRRATPEEGERIRDFLFMGGFNFVNEYAYGQRTASGGSLPEPASWKYYGVESVTNFELEHLEFAGAVLKNEIFLGPEFLWLTDSNGKVCQGATGDPLKIATFFTDLRQPPVIQITEDDLLEWRSIDVQLQKLTPEKFHLFRTFANLRTVPKDSPLFGLGLFALIESLITHKPHDQFDSLAHQVSTKMVLLSHRFCRTLPYQEFACDHLKLWKKLYEYRSCIAHGTLPDFDKGPLQVLGNRESIHRFVTEALKLLLLQTVAEPQLISDLKEC